MLPIPGGQRVRAWIVRAALCVGSVAAVHAQTTLYWDRNGTTLAGAGLSPTGTWSTSAANWNSDSAGSGTTLSVWSGTTNIANFSAGTDATTTYAVTVSGTINLSGIQVDEGAPVLSGGRLNFNPLVGFSQISVIGSNTLTINSTISLSDAAGILAKFGAGTLVLGGNNSTTLTANQSFTHGVGTLALTNANALGSASLTTTAGTTLDLRGITFTRALDLAGRTLATTSNSTSIQSGALTITANNTATIRVTSGSQLTINGSISGAGSLTKTDAGLLIVSGNKTYTGGTILANGTLRIDSTNALGTSGNLSFTGGTLRYGSGVATDLSARIDNSTDAISIDTNGQSVTYGSALRNTNTGGLEKLGTGNLTLSASNAYTGNTVFAAGNLVVNHTGALSSGNLTFTGGTLRYGIGDAPDYSSRIRGSAGAISVDTNGQTIFYNSTVNSSNTGGLVKMGAGDLYLFGSNTYTGNTVFAGGNLVVGQVGALSSGNLTFTGGALRYVIGTAPDYSGRIRGSTDSIRVDTNGWDLTFGNTIQSSNTGGFTKLGAGNLTLSAANSYTGATVIAAGVLVVGQAGALSTGNVTFTGGGLRYGSGVTTDYSARLRNSTEVMEIDVGTSTVTYASTIDASNTGGLNKLGTGTLTLGAANAYGGNTTVTEGTLVVNADGALPDATNVTVLAAGTLQVGRNETIASLSGNGTLRLTEGGNLTLTNGGTIGTLWISGNSTLNFGNNSFSVGTFIVDSGVSFLVNNQFVASNWWVSSSNQTNVAYNTRGTAPFNQVTVTGLGGDSSLTTWDSETNLVTVPEPSTYGAALVAMLGAMFSWRRWRAGRRESDALPAGRN